MKKKLLLVLFLGVFLFSTAGVADAIVLDFEGQGFGNDITLKGSGYGGFIWDVNLYTLHEDYYQTAFLNDAVNFPSGYVAAYNAYGDMSVAVSKGSFDFDGAYFTTFSYSNGDWAAGSETITMTGYAGAVEVDKVEYDLTNDFVYYAANFTGIDRLVFESDGDERHWVMDDLSYESNAAPGGVPVPEPATMSFLCLGLAVVIGLEKRIKSA